MDLEEGVITRFSDIKLTAVKTYRCSCGKRCRRQKKFYQTLNPFNKNKDGSVKTERDIIREERAKIEVWRGVADPCTHVVAPAVPA